MKIRRYFTSENHSPFDQIEWTRRDTVINNPDGSTVFEMRGAEVPASWTQLASDIMVNKYFRKAGVPQTDAKGKPQLDENGNQVLGSETSVREVLHRMAGCWRHWGNKYGYFDT